MKQIKVRISVYTTLLLVCCGFHLYTAVRMWKRIYSQWHLPLGIGLGSIVIGKCECGRNVDVDI